MKHAGIKWQDALKITSEEYIKIKLNLKSKKILESSLRFRVQKRLMEKYNSNLNYLSMGGV